MDVRVGQVCAIWTREVASVVPVKLIRRIAIPVTHVINGEGCTTLASTTIWRIAALSTRFRAILTHLSLIRPILLDRTGLDTCVRCIVSIKRERTYPYTNAKRIRVRDDTIVWLTGDIAQTIEEIVSWSTLKTAGRVGAYETFHWAFCAFVPCHVVKVQVWAVKYAWVVQVKSSEWSWALSDALACQVVRVHALLNTETFTFSCCVVCIVTVRAGAYALPSLVVFKQFMHDWTLNDTTACCLICVCVGVAVSVALGCWVLGKVSIWACLDAESCGLVWEIRPPAIYNTIQILWTSISSHGALVHTNVRCILSECIIWYSGALGDTLFSEVITKCTIWTSLGALIVGIVSKRYQSVDTMQDTQTIWTISQVNDIFVVDRSVRTRAGTCAINFLAKAICANLDTLVLVIVGKE
jgi:hypothetical protein